MLLEGSTAAGTVDCDLCILGAGAAGIALALALRDRRFDVVVAESGGLEPEPDTQELYRSLESGITTDKLHLNRLRRLGGTTGHWGGWCRPLDRRDLEPRPWVPHSGWPLPYSELERFYPRAHELVEIGDPGYDPARWTSSEDRAAGMVLAGEVWRNLVFHVSDPPTRFGSRYRRDLETAESLRVYLHANAVELETDGEARHVAAVHMATLGGHRFRVRARGYVLATGAVENARILLASRGVRPDGLGNSHGLVGRFFGQHPCYRKSLWVLADGAAARRLARRGTRDDVRIATGLAERAARDQRILNYHFLLRLHRPAEPGLWRRIRELLRAGARRDELTEAVGDLASDVDHPPGWRRGERRLFTIEERPEQAPNPDSRVTLSDERDALGMPRIDVDWRLGELDLLTVRRARELLIRELGMAGMGRIRGWPDEYDPTQPGGEHLHGGNHHFGTTRMHPDPRQGVVDASCRVHGINNLWVAGGSVYPTTGIANPTLTIVALALRLAEELGRRL